MLRTPALGALLLLSACPAPTPEPEPPTPADLTGLALTPPMGWNSWNAFGLEVDAELVTATAQALLDTGLADLGYTKVVMDDGWHGERDADGVIHENPERFPEGLRALADEVHAMGLQIGIYSDAGDKTCGGYPGSEGHEPEDARQYAAWGMDYLKYDWCYAQDLDAPLAYAKMRRALETAGRPMVFSLCEWGTNRPWEWGEGIGHLWRTTNDIADCQADGPIGINCWTQILDWNAPLHPHAGPDHWNDPDMLIVGLHGSGHIQGDGITDTEARAHFSLWCMMAAPLMIGADLRTLDATSLEILSNAELIAIDQDPLGVQGRRVRAEGGLELWTKPLANGDLAILLHNRTEAAADIAVDWTELDLPAGTTLDLRNLWTHTDLGPFLDGHSTTVEPHGVVVYRATPQ